MIIYIGYWILSLLATYFIYQIWKSKFSKIVSPSDFDDLNDLIHEIEERDNASILFIVDDDWYDKNIYDMMESKMIALDSKNCQDRFFKWIDESYGKNLKIVLHTTGGESDFSDLIFNTLLEYPYSTEAYIPFIALSGGTMVSLGCDEIYMNHFSVMGPTDPQISFKTKSDEDTVSAQSLSSLLTKQKIKLSNYMYAVAYDSRKSYNCNLVDLRKRFEKYDLPENKINRLVDIFGNPSVPHGRGYTKTFLINSGLQINSMDDDIKQIFDLLFSCKENI